MRTWVPGRSLALFAVLMLLASPSAVYASFTSTIAAGTATMTGDGTSDTLVITQAGGLFRHNRYLVDPGFASDADFNTTLVGIQTLSAMTGIININAGDGDDTIALSSAVNLRGTVDGGIGADTLDYSTYGDAANANLGLGTTGLSAILGGDQVVPPTTHAGTGTATITNYNISTRTFDINVTVSGLLPADVDGFRIHYGWTGVNGLILVDLAGLAPLVPVGTGFTFTKTGVQLPRIFEAGFLGGATYLHIGTVALAGGAIRGQLFSGGNVSVGLGAGLGVVGLTGIENLTGTPSSDSLVGSFLANTISGGDGIDQILGGPDADTLNGGVEEDLLIWSNGDGSDVINGGAGFDTVAVNGNPSAGEPFVVSPNGARVDFDRIGAAAFSLDIGTVESLTVNGLGGNDFFIVDDLAGTGLSRLDLFGWQDADGFGFVPASIAGLAVTVHGGSGSDTVQGSDSGSTFTGSLPGAGGVTGLVTAFRFVERLSGGSGTDVFNVKAFATGTPLVVCGSGNDTLNYDAEGRTVSGDTTPPDGSIASPGVQPLAFQQCEAVAIVNPFNNPPTIGPIANQTIAANGSTGALPFTIGDAETPPDSLTLSAASSNTTLVPVANIALAGGGANRTVTVTPAFNQVGAATITITVIDALGNSTPTAFVLTVNGPTTVQPPTDVYVAAMSGNAVTFRFTPAVLGPAATGFVLEGGLNPGQVLASIATGSALPIYSIVAPTGSFYVRFHATIGAERSGPSNEIRIHVNAPVTPSAPDMFSSAVDGNTVVLSWRNTFGGGAPTGLALDVTGAATTTIPLGASESLVVNGAPGGTFTLQLRALNGGGSSPQSSPVTVAIPTPCTGPPLTPSSFLAYRIGSTVYVVWEPPLTGPATASYVLNVTGSFVGSLPTPVRSISGTVGPGSYTLSVASVNPCGTSAPTAAQTVVIP